MHPLYTLKFSKECFQKNISKRPKKTFFVLNKKKSNKNAKKIFWKQNLKKWIDFLPLVELQVPCFVSQHKKKGAKFNWHFEIKKFSICQLITLLLFVLCFVFFLNFIDTEIWIFFSLQAFLILQNKKKKETKESKNKTEILI